MTPWGAYPGNSRRDIGSGVGTVHNPLMFGRVEKTVVPLAVPRVAQAAVVREPPDRASPRCATSSASRPTAARTASSPIAWHALRG